MKKRIYFFTLVPKNQPGEQLDFLWAAVQSPVPGHPRKQLQTWLFTQRQVNPSFPIQGEVWIQEANKRFGPKLPPTAFENANVFLFPTVDKGVGQPTKE
jgi:hypothetical protein